MCTILLDDGDAVKRILLDRCRRVERALDCIEVHRDEIEVPFASIVSHCLDIRVEGCELVGEECRPLVEERVDIVVSREELLFVFVCIDERLANRFTSKGLTRAVLLRRWELASFDDVASDAVFDWLNLRRVSSCTIRVVGMAWVQCASRKFERRQPFTTPVFSATCSCSTSGCRTAADASHASDSDGHPCRYFGGSYCLTKR